MTTELVGLGAALAAAQSEMPSVGKDGTNPHFRNKFVTLDNLIEKTRPVLNKHGLSIQQFPAVSELGQPTLITRITHEAGESIETAMPLFLTKQDMQAFGSAITYARRYAWASALGIAADEDDDGNQASRPAAQQPAATESNGHKPLEGPGATPAQEKSLNRLIANLSNADGSRDWNDVAEKYAVREFKHGRSELGTVEIEQVIATLTTHLDSLQVPA